jgi:hypothetical protein
MGYRAIAGPPGKTAAYQGAMALHQRAMAARETALLAYVLLSRVACCTAEFQPFPLGDLLPVWVMNRRAMSSKARRKYLQ